MLLMEDLWVMITASLVAASCGFIGCFLILRRMALLGDAISHAVLLGVVLAFLLTRNLGAWPMFAGAAVMGLLTTFLVQLFHRAGAQEDAAIGVTFTALFSLGVVLLTLYADDVHLDTEHVLFGEIAYVPWDVLVWNGVELGPRAVWMVGGVFALSLLVTGLFFKEFKLVAFDPVLAASMGFPVTLLHYVQMTLVSLTTVAAFDSVGAILAIAMLIAPGATAYLLTDRLEHMLALSVVAGVAAALSGYALAAWLDVSISGAMATAAGLLFALAFLLSPKHGVLVRRWQQRRIAPDAP